MIESWPSPAQKWDVVVILFGVSGAGKTLLGQMLAHDLHWRFYDADDFHSETNMAKMWEGIGLTDKDRQPWLKRLRRQIEESLAKKENAILACSALKERYRVQLRGNDD